MGFFLTLIGILLLLASVAAVALGLFMSADPKNRDQGRLFAIWWVPGVAAASGVLMKDVVTFVVGLVCFLVSGAVFVLANVRGSGNTPAKRRGRTPSRAERAETTRENRASSDYGEAAS